jgi:glutathione S-transferase
MTRQLYELVGEDPERRFSPYCWRIRMALAHKGLDADVVPWRFTETDRLAFAGTDKVPVLVDDDRVIHDSTPIAEYLDEAYSNAPSLFHGDPESRRFALAWTNAVLHPAVARLIVSDIPAILGEPARSYFVTSREARYGMPLAQVTAGREAEVMHFRTLLTPLRHVVTVQDYLGGAEPDYADYAVFGAFQWARCSSPFRLLDATDAVYAWQERMLDLFDGLARDVSALE